MIFIEVAIKPEQSYSERQLYEVALERMTREVSAVNQISETEAVRLIEVNLAKSPRKSVKLGAKETNQFVEAAAGA